MAIGTPVDLGGSTITGITTSATVSLTTTVDANVGDLVVVAVASSTTNRTLSSVSDGTHTYNIDVTSNDATNVENLWICSARITTQKLAGTVITATFSASVSSVRAIAAFKVSGLAVSPLDITSSDTGTSAGWTTPSTTTNQADELLVSVGWKGSAATNNPGSTPPGVNTYIELARDGGGTMDFNGSSHTLAVEYLIVSTIDSHRAAGLWSSSGARWRSAFATYKMATGSGFTNIVPPSVSGALSVGSTVTADPGTWSPVPSSFAYYWHRADDTAGTNLQEITGATGSTYTISAAESGKNIQAGVIPS